MDEALKNSEEITPSKTEEPVKDAVIPGKEENNNTEEASDKSAQEEIPDFDASEEISDKEASEDASNEEAAEDNQDVCEEETVNGDAQISSDEENEDTDENEPSQTQELLESEDDSEEDAPTILSPDELFSDRHPQTDDEEATEDAEEAVTAEIVEEDGQYKLAYIEKSSESEDIEDELIEDEDLTEEAPKYNPDKPRRVDARFDLVELFIFTLLAVMIITSFFFRHSIVDGESMENTLHSGEHLIISDFLYTPKRGDIIVCEDYTTAIRKPIVKRVIAIEGDTIKITATGGVYVNDVLLDESKYVYIDDSDYLYEEIELTVAKGEIFVMGDHRNKSTDSRNNAVGTVSVDSVIGKVLLRFYPFDKFGTVK